MRICVTNFSSTWMKKQNSAAKTVWRPMAPDWPHVANWGVMPNVGDLLDLLTDWVPDGTTRRRVLVDNPHRLYGF